MMCEFGTVLLTKLIVALAVLLAAADAPADMPPDQPAAQPAVQPAGRPTAAPSTGAPSGPPSKKDWLSWAGRITARSLQAYWPNRPEWLAMLADILQGSQLGPTDGWFPLAKSRTKYTWDVVRERFDTDCDGRVSREEFPGADTAFRTLDRDRDAAITPPDLEWPEHALVRSPGMMLFFASDRDGNGKVTKEEFDKLFEAADRDGTGFASLDDLRRILTPPSPPPSAAPVDEGPTRFTLVKGLLRQEIGSMRAGPDVGDPAPDFTLTALDGTEVRLADRLGGKPVVLVFGNFTCGPFRMQAGNVEKLYRKYGSQVEFLMIYVREAHPTDGWHMSSNDRYGITLPQPQTFGERKSVAERCQGALNFGMPFLVDTIDDAVGSVYSGMPSRLYLLDPEGRVVYKSGRGPFGFKPAELEQALLLWQADQSPPARKAKEAVESQPAAASAPVGAGAETEPKPADSRPAEANPLDAKPTDLKSEVSPKTVENPPPALTDEEAWSRLPRPERKSRERLPHWARQLAVSLPYTTAAMLECDYAFRTTDAIPSPLRARIRLTVAEANRSEPGIQIAKNDIAAAGLPPDKPLAGLPEDERRVLDFVRQLTLSGDLVTDETVRALVDRWGEPAVMAFVLQTSYGNFQDRLLTSLQSRMDEHDTPLEVRFHWPAQVSEIPAAFRPGLPPGDPAAASDALRDTEFGDVSFDELQASLLAQRDRSGRISVPPFEVVVSRLPPGTYPPGRKLRIGWSLAVMGHQPAMGLAWMRAMRTFGRESAQDAKLQETLFWVITRTINCFY